MKLTFVEAPSFTERLQARMDDESFRAMQNLIAEQPEKGKVIKDEKDDLTPKEKRMLADLAKRVRQEAVDAFRRSGGMP